MADCGDWPLNQPVVNNNIRFKTRASNKPIKKYAVVEKKQSGMKCISIKLQMIFDKKYGETR